MHDMFEKQVGAGESTTVNSRTVFNFLVVLYKPMLTALAGKLMLVQ